MVEQISDNENGLYGALDGLLENMHGCVELALNA